MKYFGLLLIIIILISSCQGASNQRSSGIGDNSNQPGSTLVKLEWTNEKASEDEIFDIGFVKLNTDNPYNNRIYAVGALNTFRLFTIDNGQGVLDLSGLSTGIIYKANFNPDGQSFYNCSMDGRIYIRSTATKVPIRILEAHVGGQNLAGGILTTVNNSTFSIIASGGLDGTLKTWDYNTGSLIKNFGVIHNGGVLDISFDKSDNYIATAGADGGVRLLQTATGTEIISNTIHQGRANSVLFIGENNDLLATAGQDARVRIIRIRDFNVLKEFANHSAEVKDLEYIPTKSLLISCGFDKRINFYSLENNSLILSIEAHNGPIYTIALSADNNYLISAGLDKRLKLWNISNITGKK